MAGVPRTAVLIAEVVVLVGWCVWLFKAELDFLRGEMWVL